MQIQIKTTPQLDTFIRNIERLSENLTDGFDWGSLAPIVAEAAEGIFASQGRGGWAQLSPAYARWKERNFPGKGILELTGAYLSAATQIGAPHNLVEVGPDHLTYGVRVWIILYFTRAVQIGCQPVLYLICSLRMKISPPR